jgi:AbrB family looped-hinge helix DNA binding protein
MSTATVTSKGQITLPKEVRDDLQLREGDRVAFEKIDGRYMLRPQNKSVMRKWMKRWVKRCAKTMSASAAMEAAVLGIDSNILVRFLTRDDEPQFDHASRLFGQAEDRNLFLGVIVLVEVSWTLRRVYKQPAKDVLQTLEDLVDARQFTIEDRDQVVRAIGIARASGADFSDALIALRNEAAGCSTTATFDRRALRIEQMTPVVELLA